MRGFFTIIFIKIMILTNLKDFFFESFITIVNEKRLKKLPFFCRSKFKEWFTKDTFLTKTQHKYRK